MINVFENLDLHHDIIKETGVSLFRKKSGLQAGAEWV